MHKDAGIRAERSASGRRTCAHVHLNLALPGGDRAASSACRRTMTGIIYVKVAWLSYLSATHEIAHDIDNRSMSESTLIQNRRNH